MKKSFLILMFGIMIFLPINDIFAADFSFTRNLRLGMSGEDVRELQKILNSDENTRINDFGPGSPGQETIYFGALTAKAVIKFQEKYKEDILIPNGLLFGTGIVGVSTRKALHALSQITNTTKTAQSDQFIQPTKLDQPVQIAQDTPKNSKNSENLKIFLSAVDSATKNTDLSKEKIDLVKEYITKEMLSTTTDIYQSFMTMVEKNSANNGPIPQDLLKQLRLPTAFNRLIDPLLSIFLPAKAFAVVGIPFGGRITSAFPCICSASFAVTITPPLPPSYATFLSYVPGSQLFANYNIPSPSWVLGTYTPVFACLIPTPIGCVGVPTQGLITPFTGSSAI